MWSVPPGNPKGTACKDTGQRETSGRSFQRAFACCTSPISALGLCRDLFLMSLAARLAIRHRLKQEQQQQQQQQQQQATTSNKHNGICTRLWGVLIGNPKEMHVRIRASARQVGGLSNARSFVARAQFLPWVYAATYFMIKSYWESFRIFLFGGGRN